MFLLLAGCQALSVVFPPARSDPASEVPELEIELSEASIELFLGESTALTLDVFNHGTASADVEVELVELGAGGWWATPSAFTVAVDGSRSSLLRLVPDTWGEASVNVRVSDQLGERQEAVVTAWVYEDADGDGAASERSGGDDCDDEHAEAFPGAEEVWYDGVDNDCLGGDDDDQDGDGLPVGTDCDDNDATVTVASAETWNGLDDDCDGVIDDLPADELGEAWLAGNTSELALGATGVWYGDAGLFGAEGDDGVLWRVALDHEGVDLSTAASGSLVAPDGACLRPLGGHAGADLVLVGALDRGEAWLVPFDKILGEVQVSSLAEVHFEPEHDGYDIAGGDLGDVDGDGIADVLLGLPTADWSGDSEEEDEGVSSVGRLALFMGGGDADVDIDDADEEMWGGGARDLFGSSISVEDLDGDGFADILIGEPGDDSGDTQAGALYLVLGEAKPKWAKSGQANAKWRVEGDSYGASVGERASPPVADLDGDGQADLIVPAPSAGAVSVFRSIASLDGATVLSDADTRWTGDVGLGEAITVLSLGGATTIVLGSPDAGDGGVVDAYMWAAGAYVTRAQLSGDDDLELGSGLLAIPGALLVGATGADDRAADGGAWWQLAAD